MDRRLRPLLFVVLAMSAPLSIAHAHPVTVDGVTTMDWSTRAPNAANLGIVARDDMQQGELVWLDADGDARTDVATPETRADLERLAITADATNLYVHVETASDGFTGSGAPLQVQIAVDLDRTTGSGQQFFSGFADTTVTDEALWEYLIRTQVRGSLTGPTVEVLDPSFSVAGTGTAAALGTTLELAIPWSAMGLAAPPDAARFTVALFRENTSTGETVPIGDSGISNALDVVSNYGDPQVSGYPNSWTEVSDSVIDYSLEAWFTDDGEVYAPVQITRFLNRPGPDATLEWIRLTNQTPLALDLADYEVGDEETPDSGEGMYSLPSATIVAGGSVMIAVNGGSYLTAYGEHADVILGGTDPLAPAATRDTTWASGTVGLSNSADEILVLGPGHSIVDVVTYGSGGYAGVTPMPAPATNEVPIRDPETQDTDDSSVDFALTAAACAASSACALCESCDAHACLPVPAGTSCDDGDMCTTATTCDEVGACGGGAPVSCDDANACTGDACDPGAGCTHTGVAAGVSCADGDLCNGDETCDGSGSCAGGSALDCDDGNTCTADSCDAIMGCGHASVAAGTSCDDGNVCTTASMCDGAGGCIGTSVSCDDGLPCTVDSCDPITGCAHVPVESGTACDDGNACTLLTTCDAAGACSGGASVSCADDGNPCTSEVCDPLTGCGHVDLAAGTPCDDGDACTTATACNAGACVGTPVTCDDGNPCTSDSCDTSLGCQTAPLGTSQSCDDGDACTSGDTCDGAGACSSGATMDCDDGNPCTADSCDSAMGCAHDPIAAGTSCDDGSVCTNDTVCDGAGSCGGGTTMDCDDGMVCTDDLCDSTEGCMHSDTASGTSCDDADACTTDTTCDGAGACTGGSALTCDDADPCTTDSCDAVEGCMVAPAPSGTSCDDGDACTLGDTCDDASTCVPGTIDPTCADAGMPDGGAIDAGTTVDASVSSDAGALLDASTPGDAAVMLDASTPSDAAVMLDASTPSDAAVQEDASSPIDASTESDAGGVVIAGGCSCRAAGGDRSPFGAALFLSLLGMAIAIRRRRSYPRS